jgi:monosaccharide-transporting ATPase
MLQEILMSEVKSMSASPVLQLRQIDKNFPGVKALQQAQLRLFAGEVHALLGENGAGKSTLVKVMTGVLQKDSGELLLDGEPRHFSDPKKAQWAGISTVYQEVNLLPNMSVAHNLFLGSEPKRFGLIDKAAMAQQARQLLSSFGLSIDVNAALADFSVAVQQLVAIARAISVKRGAVATKVLVLDEPTASLDASEVQQLFQLLGRLKQQGVAIVFISHFLDQVYQISDRITVMRNGCFVGEYLTASLPRAELIAAMLGKELCQQRHLTPFTAQSQAEVILSARQLSSGQQVQSLDLEIHQGQAVGLAGLLGSGRTEICRLLFGLEQADGGSLTLAGQQVQLTHPSDAIALGIALCPEDRKTEGMIAPLSIRENICLALQAKQGWWRWLSRKKQQQLADFYIEKLKIVTPDSDKAIGQLSGGNQQKVILARWLAAEPKLLLLDEPTRGIDIGAHAEILQLIRQLCQQGMSLLVASSELEELTAFAGKVVVMRDRKKVAELQGQDLNADQIMAAIAGGAV